MAEDVASLGFEIDSKPLAESESRMRAMEAAAKRLGITVEEMQNKVKNASANVAMVTAKQTTATEAASGATRKHAQEIAGLERALASMVGQLERNAEGLGRMGQFLVSLGPIGVTVGATVGTLVIAFEALNKEAEALGKRSQDLATFATVSGLTAEQIQVLNAAATELGVGTNELRTFIDRFTVNLQQVKLASGEFYDQLRAISPEYVKQIQNSKNTAEALNALAKAYVAAGAAGNKLAVAAGGRGALLAAPVLQQIGTEGGVEAMTHHLSDAITRTAAENEEIKRLNGQLDELKERNRDTFALMFSAGVLQGQVQYQQNLSTILGWLKSIRTTVDNFVSEHPWLKTFGFLGGPAGQPELKITVTGGEAIPQQQGPSRQEAAEGARRLANEQKDLNAAMGAGATIQAQYNQKLEDLNASYLENKLSLDQYNKAVDNTLAEKAAKLSSAQAAALGDAATQAQKYAARQAELAVQLGRGEISAQDMAKALEDLKKAQSIEFMRDTVSALGDAATSTEKYALQVAELQKKLDNGKISQDTFNRAVSQLNPTIVTVKDVTQQLGDSLAKAFIQGQNAADALNSALKAVASTAASSAIKNLTTGLTGGGFDLTSIATNGLVAVGASLLSRLFGSDTQKAQEEAAAQAKVKAAEEQLRSAQDSLGGLVDQLRELNNVAGDATRALQSAQKQFRDVQAAAAQAQLIASTEGGVTIPAAVANAAFAAANQAIADASAQLQEFTNRTIDNARAALQGSDALSSTAQAIQDLDNKAVDLSDALLLAGKSAEEASYIVENDFAIGLQRLMDQLTNDIARKINELAGAGWINQLNDLFTEINDAAGLVDPGLLTQYLSLSAQKIVDDAKLTGQAFQDLLALFPDLTGVVHEFNASIVDAAQALEDAAKAAEDAANRAAALNDRLFAATHRGDTLEAQLVRFDYEAQKQREAEIKAGGQNITLLETTLAYERANVIQDYNDKILADQKKAEQDRLDAIKKANEDIVAYLQGLLTGSLSPLSARAQLEAARSAYNAQLALARAGDLDALQNITKAADELLRASQAFFGSSRGYQSAFQQVQAELGGLAGHATGGWITGAASGRDSVPIMAMPGEYMLQRSVAQANAAWLPAFNATGRLPMNDNSAEIRNMGAVLGSLLSKIASLEEEGNAKLDTSIAVTVGQTQALAREQRFATRKRTAQG